MEYIEKGDYIVRKDDWQEELIQAILALTEEVRAQGELNRINNTVLARRLKDSETPAD